MLLGRQLPLRDGSRLRRHEIPQRICRIITANALLVRVNLQHNLRAMLIVLHRRQRLNQSPAPFGILLR
jgi:hypothetical protein